MSLASLTDRLTVYIGVGWQVTWLSGWAGLLCNRWPSVCVVQFFCCLTACLPSMLHLLAECGEHAECDGLAECDVLAECGKHAECDVLAM